MKFPKLSPADAADWKIQQVYSLEIQEAMTAMLDIIRDLTEQVAQLQEQIRGNRT